ncbi:amino acid adenylation domain-containing protein [Pedobacter sp. MC2016-15]|uniref:non-ribosomal peptide synthetase n=1 Tax=Pedobacter sp. MC2016-15 TaxID=2994473 RepID=UPI0022459C4B|nr:amino acid adenylation domain-containing protein [Pedobacter sp. MC2016-15]MCX2479526.1 amino acid adenylation domain-containing protein [Pedobacter sp. MC2016-15]
MINSKDNFTFKKVDFDPFASGEVLHTAPATEPQKEIWTSCMLGGKDASRGYNESVSLRLKGTINVDYLRTALENLIERHEALRSAFSQDGSTIIILDRVSDYLTITDLSKLSAADQERALKDYVLEDALFLFNLLDGPLFKAGIHKLSEQEYHFTFTGHHIVCDGWSLGIILQDLSKFYSALAVHRLPALPEAKLLTEFAREQLVFADSKERETIEKYWLGQYNKEIPVLDMPTSNPRPAARTYKSKRLDFQLDADLLQGLKATGKAEGSSLVLTLLSSFEIFLHLITGQKDIVVGLPASGQSITGNYNLVGHCVNLLPLRSRPSKNYTFKEYLKLRKPGILDAFDHQQITWGNLLRKLKVARDPSRIPLVPVVFNVDMGLDDGVAFEGLEYELISNPREYESFELFINASGSEKSFTLEWSFNTQLFDEQMIRQMMDGYEHILRFIVAHPASKISDLLVPGTSDYLRQPVFKRTTTISNVRQISSSGEKTDLGNLTIQQLFENAAQIFKDKPAISFKDEIISYSNLNIRADNLSRAILHYAPDEEIIGISTTRELNMVVAVIAILKAGKAYLPLDPTYPEDRLNQIIDDSGLNFCVASAIENKFFNKLDLETIDFDRTYSLPEQPLPFENSNAYVLYTSGSTGKPKGVYLTQRALVNLIIWQNTHSIANSESKTLQFAPLTFDVSFQEIFATLTTGGQLILIDDVMRLNPDNLLAKIERNKINRIYLPFVALQFLSETAVSIGKFPATLQEVMTAGEQLKITPQVESFFKGIPGCVLYNQYGPTECHVVTQLKLSGNPSRWPGLPNIGTPIANTDIYITDENLEILGDGEIGELCIAGASLASGYLNKPELTGQKFLPLNLQNNTQTRIYRTGDLARILTDGNIEFIGRNDDQVKIRGYRIEIGEIEVMLNRVPGIAQAVVTAREDHNGQKRLVAYLLSSNGQEDTSYVRTEIQHRLPVYMIPSVFVWMKEFPRTSSGKIDKLALPAPDQLHFANQTTYTAPQTETEKQIVAIWEELLNVKDIGIDDNFFELGGHSLIAIQFMIQIEKANSHGLPLATLFEYPTIRTLARLFDGQNKPTAYTSLVPIKPTGSKTPIYIVHGGGYNVLNFSGIGLHVDTEQPVFGIQAQGLDGVEEPMDNMEDIARYYIESILVQNPTGPYALAGYSFGGYVVIEMARQLRLMGHDIKLLAIFDTNAKNLDFHGTGMGVYMEKVKKQLPKFWWIVKSLVRNPKKTLSYQKFLLMKKVNSVLGVKDVIEERQGAIYEIMRRIDEKYEIAYQAYKLAPFNEKVHLFRATDNVYFVEDWKSLGWQKYAMKGVEVYDVPGDHKTMLLAPFDKSFARKLQEVLDNVS